MRALSLLAFSALAIPALAQSTDSTFTGPSIDGTLGFRFRVPALTPHLP